MKAYATIPGYRRLSRRERADAIEYPADVERPKTRGECENGQRPCPFVSCKWHLYLNVDPLRGSIHTHQVTISKPEKA